MSTFKAKMHQKRLPRWWGAYSDPHSPDPLAGFKGLKGREGAGAKETGGRRRGRRRGKGRKTPSRIGKVKRWQPYAIYKYLTCTSLLIFTILCSTRNKKTPQKAVTEFSKAIRLVPAVYGRMIDWTGDNELTCAWRLPSGRGGGTSTVEDLPDRRSWQQVVATQKVGDVAADWNDDCHDQMRQRRESSALLTAHNITVFTHRTVCRILQVVQRVCCAAGPAQTTPNPPPPTGRGTGKNGPIAALRGPWKGLISSERLYRLS